MRIFPIFLWLCIIHISCSSQSEEAGKLPEQVDHSKTVYFPEIGDQGVIGACDWFAAVYYQMTFLYNQQSDREASDENTFSPKFGYNFHNNAGMFPYNIRVDDVYKFVKKHGSATLADVPYDMATGTGYTSWCTDASVWDKAATYRIKDYAYFTLNDRSYGADYSFESFTPYLEEIKKYLSHGEILVIQSFPYEYCTFKKVMDDPATKSDDDLVGEYILVKGNNSPEHTMAVVGYNDNLWVDLNKDGKVQPIEKGALKIVDSFGIDQKPERNDGFFWMAYSTVESSIFEHRVNRMIVREDYKPDLLCRITMNTPERDMIRFQFGWSPETGKKAVQDSRKMVFDPCALGFEPGTSGVSLIKGGNFAYDGGREAIDGSFVFDLTDIFQPDSDGYYYLRVENKGDKPLLIKEFEIIDKKTGKRFHDSELPESVMQGEIYRFVKYH